MFKTVAKLCQHRTHRGLSNPRGQVASRDAYRRWLRYEPLEDRCLLSVSAPTELLSAYQVDPNLANQVASFSQVGGTLSDKIVTISAIDSLAGEPSNNGTYRISRTGSTTNALTVGFTADGDATQGRDYVLTKGTTVLDANTVTIDAGQLYVDVTLVVIDDSESELTETATLTLQNRTGYEINDRRSASITIADNDVIVPIVATVLAIDDGAGEPSNNGTYRISRTGITALALDVNFTVGGDAVQGTDYVLKNGTTPPLGNTVTIASGQSYVDVTLEVVNDTTREPTETASLTLTTGSGYEIGAINSASIRIIDDDAVVVTVSATDGDAEEPSNNGTYRISRTGITALPLDVNFTMSGDAVQGTDYVLNNGTAPLLGNTVTIDAGQSYVDITLVVMDDAISEPTKAATLTVQAGPGYEVGAALSSTNSNYSNATNQASVLGLDVQTRLENIEPYVVSVDSPSNHVVSAEAGFAGVGQVIVQKDNSTWTGSGTLLAGTNWLLTAAHVVWSDTTHSMVSPSEVVMYFDLPAGRVVVPATQVVVHPSYNGNVALGNDLALIQLQSVPSGLEGFDIYTNPDEVGEVATLVGYGMIGTGATGGTEDGGNLKRRGQNRYDATGSLMGYANSILVCDFDNGSSQNDAMGVLYGLHNVDADIGVNEVAAYHGDSGGAWFIDGKIATVVSFGWSVPGSHDVVPGTNASFGDFGGDTRVSAFADWIQGIAHIGTSARNSATITIVDDDPIVVTVSAPDSDVGEPSSNGTYRISRLGNTTSSLTVNFTVGGDATRGTDYVLNNGTTLLTGNTVTISAGQPYVDITLAVVDDTMPEPTETASLTLQAGTSYQVGVSSSTAISIADNDEFAVTVSAINSEAGAQSNNGTYRITRTGITNRPLLVDFTMGGNAVRDVDYTLVTGWTSASAGTPLVGNVVTIGDNPAGSNTSYIDITLVVLHNIQVPTTATLTLTTGTGYGVGTVSSATITIAAHSVQQQIVGDVAQVVNGAAISIPVRYSVSNNDNTLAGLGLRLHYDSRFMTYGSLGSLLQTGLVSQQTAVNETVGTDTDDGDPNTDKYILVAWADLAGNWPNQALPALLYVANFTLASGLADGATSTVNFTAASNDVNYSFGSRSITVVASLTNLDVDGNGKCDALTDGALMMRYLFDPNGPWTTTGAVGAGATRTTHDQVKAYLDAGQGMLDVDGNGRCDALSDGMLIMRYLFDPAGTWTTDGLTGTGATRTTQADVKAFLDVSYFPQPAPTSLSLQLNGMESSHASPTVGKTVQNQQIITPSQTNLSTKPGTHATFDVNYSTNPADSTLSGLGLRMYYNSSLLTFNGLSNALATGKISQQSPADDKDDSDGDATTDKYVLVAWADMSQNWPGALTQRLYTADFTLKSDATSPTHVNFGASSTAAGWTLASTPVTITPTAVQATPNLGPTISGVMVVETTAPRDGVLTTSESLVLTFNAVDPQGVASATLLVDGKKVAPLYGPYVAASGANFGASLGTLSAGTHNYSIVATDKAGNVTATAYTGSFNVVIGAMSQQGPTIGGILVVEATAPRDGELTTRESLAMTFNAVDPDGVASATVLVDGHSAGPIYGPYAAASGVNFGVSLGTLSAGTHTYSIVATDKAGNPTAPACTGTFNVVTAVDVGPTISGLLIVEAAGPRDGVLTAGESLAMTFNAVDADGVAGAAVLVDGHSAGPIYGPYAAASGVNFGVSLGKLSAGTHSYSIVATDKAGNPTATAYTGTFDVAATVANVGPTISGVAVASAYRLISWNVLDPDGVASASLTIDGATVSKINGPYAAASGVNFSGVFGALSSGSHTYVITASDTLGKSSQSAGTFKVAALTMAANNSPAAQRVDLLTAVMDEMGHVLDDEHSDSLDLMYSSLSLGTRRSPGGESGLTLDTGDRLVNTNVLDHILASV